MRALLFVTPGDFYIKRRYHNANIDLVIEAIYELARVLRCIRLGLSTKSWAGITPLKKWQSDGLARGDLIHYSEEGYVLQGKMLYQGIMDGYEKRFD